MSQLNVKPTAYYTCGIHSLYTSPCISAQADNTNFKSSFMLAHIPVVIHCLLYMSQFNMEPTAYYTCHSSMWNPLLIIHITAQSGTHCLVCMSQLKVDIYYMALYLVD